MQNKFLSPEFMAWFFVKVSWLGKLVSMFWSVEMDFFSLDPGVLMKQSLQRRRDSIFIENAQYFSHS